MFPFPGTPLYVQLFGPPDDEAWERAHHYYTATSLTKASATFRSSDRPIEELESARSPM